MGSGMESERDTALTKTLELEAALGSATEERRGLLERCVSSEAETERTRGITLELRRKLDDAHAALHELGRENQSIQVNYFLPDLPNPNFLIRWSYQSSPEESGKMIQML